jgi:uncharacterized protein (TIGR03083 family)
VKDVVAHVTGVAADVELGTVPAELDLVGALDDPALAAIREEMTARQVASRGALSLEAILAEWRGHLGALLAMIRGERPFPREVPFADAILVTDLAVHTQDVRGALGVPGDRDSAGMGVALASYGAIVGVRSRMRGLPALRLHGGKERILGEDGGEPGASLSADRFQICRALSGRRSRAQILQMDWSGDPGPPYVGLIPAYGPREDDVVEEAAPG